MIVPLTEPQVGTGSKTADEARRVRRILSRQMLDRLTPASFEPHRDSTFWTTVGEDEVELRLAAVERLAVHPGAPRPEPFSLVFSGPPERPLEQSIHRLRHDVLGELDIFLVPIGPGPEGAARYEAVFN